MIINPLAFLDEFVLSADESICPKQERTAHAGHVTKDGTLVL